MKKLSILGAFLVLTGVSLPGNFLSAHANSNQILLRYAEENLGSLQTLNDFNISTSNVTVTKDSTRGIVMTTGGSQASSVFLKEQMAVDQTSPGFSTYFVMNVYKLNAGSGDGYVFIISANSNSLGSPGGGLGYGGIANSLGIEFDFYDNGGEAIASSDIFLNGVMPTTPGTRFDANFPSKWNNTSTGNLVRAYHTWIEYDYANSVLELRVGLSDNNDPSVSRPARPANPLIRRTGFNAPQISQFFYAGFSAGTGGAAQMNGIKSWYFSNAYVPGGIDVTQSFVIDKEAPTAPEITIQPETAQVTLSGGTDNNEVAGYQYRTPSSNWLTYTSPIELDALGTYQSRTIDRAGNTSLISTFSRIDIIYYINNQNVSEESVYVLGNQYSITRNLVINPYRYAQWFTTNTLTGSPVTSVNASTSVIGLHGKPEQYIFSVQYQLNDGSTDESLPSTYLFDETFTLPTPAKEGHTFAGWYTNAQLTQPFNPLLPGNKDLTIYAKWNVNFYTLTFTSPFSSTPIAQLTLPFGNQITALPTLSRDGYRFLGWFDGDNQVNVGYSTPARDVTIVATFEGLSSTVILITANSTTIITLTSGQQIGTLPTPQSKVGYTFLGWSLVANNKTQLITSSTVVENGLTIRLYPIWEKAPGSALSLQSWTQKDATTGISMIDLLSFSAFVGLGLFMVISYVRRSNGTI